MMDPSTELTRQEAAARFVHWLEQCVVKDGRGDDVYELVSQRADRFWLGKLGSESAEWKKSLGQRGQRLDPCAAGFRFRRIDRPIDIEVSFRVWKRVPDAKPATWRKSEAIHARFSSDLPEPGHRVEVGGAELGNALRTAGCDRHQVRCEIETSQERDYEVSTVTVVNATREKKGFDSNIYEVAVTAQVGPLEPFTLEALPDSFRYDRRVWAYGINCGVEYDGAKLTTTDTVVKDQGRPTYWAPDAAEEPDLSFETLAEGSTFPLEQLVDAFEAWYEQHWSQEALDARATQEGWSDSMCTRARAEAEQVAREVEGCRAGVELLKADPVALRAFALANRAFIHSARGRYSSWRPFQLGFLLSVLPSVLDGQHTERRTVDTLWFATGGGKTETYLAVILAACFFDRLTGKRAGITAWSRFPLRMLSLQQTQRFADALAGAELVRRQEGIDGDAFALGFFVGQDGTPNKIRKDGANRAADSEDGGMPERNRVLLHCPFCFSEDLQMVFDRRAWSLQHRCPNAACPWSEEALPFYVVDEEIYRFLPSVVIGTLDKAALLGMQAAAKGLVGSPIGRCSGEGHGFTYAPRSMSPNGCLVPGCTFDRADLGQDRGLFAMRLHVQDELHLLRDNLGAVDSHYETLIDHLHEAVDEAAPPKVIASSATLAGFEQQSRELYSRDGRAFPLPGPAESTSFWTTNTSTLMRRFVGIAPRGQTLEFVNERIVESVQNAVRRLLTEPQTVCNEIGVDEAVADFLIEHYGTQVVYGIRVRDVEAAGRALDTQSPVEPLNVGMLTGATLLNEVRDTLERLDHPEPDFADRLHVICASSMMSHGVDIDRFNVMTMLGVPLTTAEFIQTSARIGRRWPGLVFVLHRMGVERDSSVFRSFPTYISHGNRFVAPIAITRRSRRVLRNTFPGLWASRVLFIHEPRSVGLHKKSLSTADKLRTYAQAAPIHEDEEFEALCAALRVEPDSGEALAEELREQVRLTFGELLNPGSSAKFVGEIPPRSPMRSLRDVESQIPIYEGHA